MSTEKKGGCQGMEGVTPSIRYIGNSSDIPIYKNNITIRTIYFVFICGTSNTAQYLGAHLEEPHRNVEGCAAPALQAVGVTQGHRSGRGDVEEVRRPHARCQEGLVSVPPGGVGDQQPLVGADGLGERRGSILPIARSPMYKSFIEFLSKAYLVESYRSLPGGGGGRRVLKRPLALR